jgi:hypothetical protein
MKFLLKIFVFMAIILFSKFTAEEPAEQAIKQEIKQPKAAFVHYSPQADTTTTEKGLKEEIPAEVYN